MAKKKISAARRKALKDLRRKHGLGEFKKSSHKSNKKNNPKVKRKMARKKSRSNPKRKGLLGGLQKPLVSGITFAFLQPILSQFLKRFNIGVQDEFVFILAAVVLKNTFRNQIVQNWANAAIIINTASLTSPFDAPFHNRFLFPMLPRGVVGVEIR